MTNAELQTLITTYGDRICCIMFDNAFKILIGYPGSECVHADELILDSSSGQDLVGVRSKSHLGDDAKKGVTWVTYHLTECIQSISIMDEKFADYRADPMIIH